MDRVLAPYTWPDFLAKREDRRRQAVRHGVAAEKVAEAILEDLFTEVLDWSSGDIDYQVDYGVLRAYQDRCAVCRLRRRELLSAAHILPDGHPRGEPIVANGLALCALHHAAFDRHVLGIRPDLTVELSVGLLREADGPMLQHGLHGFHGTRILVPETPRLHPNPNFLAERYELFRRAG